MSPVFEEKINRGDTAEVREIVVTKKGVSFIQEKNRGDTLRCRPG